MCALKRDRNKVKTVEWEKNRRNKLNETFAELGKLLPDHDPALVMTKVEILNKSIAYIKEMKEKNVRFIEGNCSETLKSEVESMKQVVVDLKSRNRQLVAQLRDLENSRKITVAPFTPPRKWVGKLSELPSDKLSIVLDLPSQKDSKVNEKPVMSSTSSKSALKTIKKIKKINAKSIKKQVIPNKAKKTKFTSTPLKEINNGGVEMKSKPALPEKKTGILPTSCTSVPSLAAHRGTVPVTKPSPVVSTDMQPILKQNHSLSTLGPGTLIMADGRVVPVPAPATQIIVNRPAPQTALFLMQNLPPVKTVIMSQPRPIMPKSLKRDTTKTTYVNKVPIPAISTYSNALLNKTVPSKENKKMCSKKKIQNNVTMKETVKHKSPTKEVKTVDNKCTAEKIQGKNPSVVLEKCLLNEKVNKKHDSISVTKNQTNDRDTSLDDLKNPQVDDSNPRKRKDSSAENIKDVKRLKHSESCNNENKINKLPPKENDDAIVCNDSEVVNSSSIPEKEDTCEFNSIDKITNNTSPQDSKTNTNLEVNKEISIVRDAASTLSKSNLTTDLAIQDNSGVTEKHNIAIREDQADNNESKTNHSCQHVSENKITEKTHTEFQNCKTSQNSFPLEQPTVLSSTSNSIERTPNSNLGHSKISENEQLSIPQNQENPIKPSSAQTLNKTSTQSDLTKPAMISADKSNSNNKIVIQDDVQELSTLFPADAKLQSCHDGIFRESDFRDRNLFMPVSQSYMDEVRLSLPHSEYTNDLFSSLQVPSGGQNPESNSPTAAFLLSFPLVSTSKTSELMGEAEVSENQHPTPTTILQIGNIDPPANDPYHQTLMLDGNLTGLTETSKLSKAVDSAKNNTASKQQKGINNFNQLQVVGIGELMRNEGLARNNNCGKVKKNFIELQNEDLYLTYHKKKQSGRTCEYPVLNFPDKSFEHAPSNTRNNGETHHLNDHLAAANTSQQKSSGNSSNVVNSYNSYNHPSQLYPFGNDFSLSTPNCLPANRSVNELSKSSQISSNYNSVTWSTSTISGTTNHIDYSSPYYTNTQKPYIDPPYKIVPQKNHEISYEEQVMKEKSASYKTLPNFSSNFQFNHISNINGNNHPSHDTHNYPLADHTDNINYKLETKSKKAKVNNLQRPPVNWMTTPDIRPTMSELNAAPSIPDATYQLQKDLEYTSAANNVILNSSNPVSHFNIPSTMTNNPQTFYSNSHFTGLDFPFDFAPIPETTCSNKPPCGQPNPQQYSWSPSKSSVPLLPQLDTHMIPSTLPTLVGDLALGTSTPSGPVDTFRTLNVKRETVKQDPQKQGNSKSPDKESFARRNSSRILPDYCQKNHSQHSTNPTTSFLSVSQLVDQVKNEQNSSRRGGKQSGGNKTSSHKRNVSLQTDKTVHSKIVTNLNNSNNFQPPNSISTGPINQSKSNIHHGYQESTGAGPPWQQSKVQRSSTHYKGSYSAESLIGDNQTHDLPPYPASNPFPSQYNHPTCFQTHSLSSQEIQPLDFNQQNSHQNCFHFPTQNSNYSVPFNPENDFHLGLDPLYSFNPTSKNISCQTSSHGIGKDNRSNHKRVPSSKRREDCPTQQMIPHTSQVYLRNKESLSHPTTTSLTNFNLSTIFPEINDKRSVPGTNNTFHITNKHGDAAGSRPNVRNNYPLANFNSTISQVQQTGLQPAPAPPHFAPVELGPPAPPNNFRPP